MSRTTALLLGALLLTAAAPPEEPATSRWSHNARRRVAEAIEQLERGESEAALEAFGQALELRPEDPLVQYDAGTAALVAGAPAPNGDSPAALLETAASAAPIDLGADAFYNLGTARLAAREPAQAIDAFEQSLRLEPERTDAKHNLELARRMLEEQRREQQEQQQQEGDEESPESEAQNPPREESGEDDPGDQEQQRPSEGDTSGDENRPEPGDESRQPLPDFEEQPEMTAEQAAAILEAVENLEREQRRQQALEQRKRGKGDEDW